MKTIKTKASTIARIGALLVAVINQCLALFGHDVLPFGENFAYQLISLIATIIIAAINCWYNNDVSVLAKLTGKIFDAFNDGKITEEEMEAIIAYANSEEAKASDDSDNAFLVGLANGILTVIKEKTNESK